MSERHLPTPGSAALPCPDPCKQPCRLLLSWLSIRAGLVLIVALVSSCAGLDGAKPWGPEQSAADAAPSVDATSFPTLDDYWNGLAVFEVDVDDTRLPMGESDTVVLDENIWRSYVHASDRSLGVVDSCGTPVPFPGCIVRFESTDAGRTFRPVRDDSGTVTCMIACRSCPCDSRRDHIDQQQYPRVVRQEPNAGKNDQWISEKWIMVYEYRGSVFVRTSANGLDWSQPAQLPQTGTWRTWLMPCRSEESIGAHPNTPRQYDCLVGGPPGIAVTDGSGERKVFVFVGLGQNPGSMGCYRGDDGKPALLRKCDNNPLFTGAHTYGEEDGPVEQANASFDFRTISSADLLRVGDRFYMLYEGVRGPAAGAPGDTQFNLGLARTVTEELDGEWETYAGNPILLDVPGNIGVGHADVIVYDGQTFLFTSLDGVRRSRLALRWK